MSIKYKFDPNVFKEHLDSISPYLNNIIKKYNAIVYDEYILDIYVDTKCTPRLNIYFNKENSVELYEELQLLNFRISTPGKLHEDYDYIFTNLYFDTPNTNKSFIDVRFIPYENGINIIEHLIQKSYVSSEQIWYDGDHVYSTADEDLLLQKIGTLKSEYINDYLTVANNTPIRTSVKSFTTQGFTILYETPVTLPITFVIKDYYKKFTDDQWLLKICKQRAIKHNLDSIDECIYISNMKTIDDFMSAISDKDLIVSELKEIIKKDPYKSIIENCITKYNINLVETDVYNSNVEQSTSQYGVVNQVLTLDPFHKNNYTILKFTKLLVDQKYDLLLQYYNHNNVLFMHVINDDSFIFRNQEVHQKFVQFVYTYEIPQLIDFVIRHFFLLYNSIIDAFGELDKQDDIYTLKFYTKKDEGLVMKIMDTYYIPINKNNLYLYYSESSKSFVLRFYAYTLELDSSFSEVPKTITLLDDIKTQTANPFIQLLFTNPLSIENFNYLLNINSVYVNKSKPEYINSWISCYDRYIRTLHSDLDFLDALRFYTHTGDVLMHSVLRGTYVSSLATVPQDELLKRINIINKGIYDSFNFRLQKCSGLKPIYLFRGFTRNCVVTKDSIVNNHRGQFISFSSNPMVAKGFSSLVYRLIVDSNDKYLLPLHDIKSYDGKTITQYPHEDEWLLPLNTSFIVVSDAPIYDTYTDSIMIDIKIHHQEYIENITQDTFQLDTIKNIPVGEINVYDKLVK